MLRAEHRGQAKSVQRARATAGHLVHGAVGHAQQEIAGCVGEDRDG